MVSCIMPTRNRRHFVARAIEYFQRQDYPHRELIVVDDGDDPVADLIPNMAGCRYIRIGAPLPVGAKRNLACEAAKGEVILHWDDDDWYADWRIRYQVHELIQNRAEICGVVELIHFDLDHHQGWILKHRFNHRNPWLAGNSLCYRREVWQSNPFLKINVGEDQQFIAGNQSNRILALDRPDFLISIIHSGNISLKKAGPGWTPCPELRLRMILGRDWEFYSKNYTGNPATSTKGHLLSENRYPLVSCLMATKDRRRFIPQAINYFLAQDYRQRELIILDDGDNPVQDLIPNYPQIRYLRLDRQFRLGVKRNILCSLAAGEIILFWDDDDWYSPARVSCQIAPILSGEADLTALGQGLMLNLEDCKFWRSSTQLHEQMWYLGVYGGTMAFHRSIWDNGMRFTDEGLGEDAVFIREVLKKGARLKKVENNGLFVYVRHQSNSWVFQPGKYLNEKSWKPVASPRYIPSRDLEFYRVSG